MRTYILMHAQLMHERLHSRCTHSCMKIKLSCNPQTKHTCLQYINEFVDSIFYMCETQRLSTCLSPYIRIYTYIQGSASNNSPRYTIDSAVSCALHHKYYYLYVTPSGSLAMCGCTGDTLLVQYCDCVP